MKNAVLHVPHAVEAQDDPRWQLIHRILESNHFSGSARLRDFLLYITSCAVRGTPEEATEQQIGIHVFHRTPGFNSSDDSIVRSQARLLRIKLAAYFAADGLAEPLVMDIPKGHYLPVFHPAAFPDLPATSPPSTHPPLHVLPESQPIPSPPDISVNTLPAASSVSARRWSRLALILLPWVLLLLAVGHRIGSRQQHLNLASPVDRLWQPFLTGQSPLVIYSNALFTGDARSGMHYASKQETDAPTSALIDHYTGIGELNSVHQLTQLFDRHGAEFLLKRSPLVTWDEARLRNLIFIGSIAENPSLKVLPSTQDFTLIALPDAAGFVNHHPQPGEPATYLRPEHPLTSDYAVVALLPGVQPGRQMLVFSGLTTLGTQAAVDYLCDPASLAALMPKIESGGHVHNFEALLEVSITGGVPLQTKLVTLRLH
jgi:hypothetical protein